MASALGGPGTAAHLAGAVQIPPALRFGVSGGSPWGGP